MNTTHPSNRLPQGDKVRRDAERCALEWRRREEARCRRATAAVVKRSTRGPTDPPAAPPRALGRLRPSFRPDVGPIAAPGLMSGCLHAPSWGS